MEMRMKFLLVLCCCGFFLPIWLSGNPISIEADGCTLITGKKGTFTISDVNHATRSGRFFVVNGKTGQRETLTECASSEPDQLILQTPSGCRLEISLSKRNRMVLAETLIINHSEQEIWVEPGLELDLPLSGSDHFYNGVETLAVGSKPLVRDGLKAMISDSTGAFGCLLPLTSLIGPETSWSLGSVMFDALSHHAARLIPSKNNARLEYSSRWAIAPGRQSSIRFIIGSNETKYGVEEGAIQAMHDSFPECWIPEVGYDNKYIWNAHAMYQAWTYKPSYEAERRFRSRWDWAYAPYKRCGDIFGRPEFWDYEPLAHPFQVIYPWRIAGGVFDYRTMSCEEFHRRRKEVFDKYGKKFGYAFYADCAGVFCELGLANKLYPDALNTDTEGGVVYIYRNGWTTGHDQDVRVFPLRTSFARQYYQDLRDLYKEIEPPGFSLDCTGYGAFYRGPASNDPDMPCRSYDKNGVFVDQGVAQKMVIDFIHNELNPGAAPKDKPFVVGNGSLKFDAAMFEASVFKPVFNKSMPAWRYLYGALPGVIHGKGYETTTLIPEWRQMNTEQFLERFTPLAVYEVFSEFRWALSGTRQVYCGNALGQYALPELLECIKLGWQPQIPVKCDTQEKIIYKARYSRGENTVFFFGNPYEQPMPVRFAIGNKELGNGHYIFNRKMRDSATLEQKITLAETSFSASLISRYPVLYEALCGLSHVPASGLKVTASSVKDIDRIEHTIKIDAGEEFFAAITPRAIPQFEAPEIYLNGEIVSAGCDVRIPADAEIKLKYKSSFFALSAEDVLQFPFLDVQQRPQLAVRLTHPDSAAEREQAMNMNEYFEFCAQPPYKLCKPGKVEIKTGAAPAAAAELVLDFSGTENKITRDGNTMKLVATDDETGEEMVRQLCYVMDRRFQIVFSFTNIDGFSGELLDHLKLRDKSVPVNMVRCFENGSAK